MRNECERARQMGCCQIAKKREGKGCSISKSALGFKTDTESRQSLHSNHISQVSNERGTLLYLNLDNSCRDVLEEEEERAYKEAITQLSPHFSALTSICNDLTRARIDAL